MFINSFVPEAIGLNQKEEGGGGMEREQSQRSY